MKVKVTVSIGLAGCKKQRVVDYDDEDWRDMTDKDRDEVMHDIMHEMVDWGYEEVE